VSTTQPTLVFVPCFSGAPWSAEQLAPYGKNAATIMREGIPDAREVVLPRTGHMFRFSHAGLVDRRTSTGDRRHVELSPTPDGDRVATTIAGIEDTLYRMIDAAGGHDTDAILGFLHDFVDTLPAGQALARRLTPE
jgi:hypothetical protein